MAWWYTVVWTKQNCGPQIGERIFTSDFLVFLLLSHVTVLTIQLLDEDLINIVKYLP